MRGTGAEGAGSIAQSIARAVRAEGLAAVRDRLWDRTRDAVLRARCVRDARSPWPAAPILNVIGVPMTTAFGGVPLQLRARLRRESMLRPVALLSRDPSHVPGATRLDADAHAATAARADIGRSGDAVRAGDRIAAIRARKVQAQKVQASTPSEPSATTAHDRGGWRLEVWADGRPRRAMTFPAGGWDGDPLREDPAWLHAVRTCVGLVNARAIHIENAAGLSIISMSALMGIDAPTDGPRVPVVLSVHDLSLVSRHPHGSPTRTHADSPASPVSGESLVDDRQRFEHAFHHALGTGILRAAAFTIYPSQFMRHRIEALPHLPAHVVAPGIEPPARTPRSARRPDRIALLGGGQAHKGGPRLARIAALLAARGMHVTSYGGYGHEHLLQMRGISGVRVRGYYRAGTLHELLACQGASVALILSTVPESFSLVLSEAWLAGVPVVAPASGAFVERLRADRVHGGGTAEHADRQHANWEHAGSEHADAEHAVAGGLLLSEDPSDDEIVEAVERARQTSWPALPAPPTAAQAAERHLSLYRAAGFMTTAR